MKKSIIKATFIVTLLTIMSKPLGFIREAILASKIGISGQTDAFFLAQNMPSLLFPCVCTALSTAFLSIYIEKIGKDGELESNKFATSALLTNILIAFFLSILSIVLSPIIVKIFAPGFSKDTLDLSIKLTRLVMISFVFLMIQYMSNSVLNSKEFYIGNQLGGIIYNIFIIASILLISKNIDITFLTIIYVIASILQSVFLFFIMNRKVKLSMPYKIINSDVIQMLKLALPILIGNSVIQLNGIVDKMLASNLGSGSVSALSYSNTLNNFVISIIIMSLITVFYPTIINCVAEDDYKNLNRNIRNSVYIIILILAPISIITFLYSYDIVNIAYGRGEFDIEAIKQTSSVLGFYAIGYVFIGLREILVKIFYAFKDMKTPMLNSILSVWLNIILSILLSKYFGIKGIAIGTVISNLCTSILLTIFIKRKFSLVKLNIFKINFIKIFFSNIITTILILILSRYIIIINSFIRFSLVTIAYFAIYSILLLILKCDEMMYLVSLLKAKIKLIK